MQFAAPRTAARRGAMHGGGAARAFRERVIDVLACAGCGGRLRLLATIEDPATVTKILAHLGLSTGLPALTPARLPLQQDGVDFT